MTSTSTLRTRAATALVVFLLVLAAVPAAVSAQETRAGGIVTVDAGETHTGDLVATAGTVIVAGTVDGNLDVTAGTVVVSGTVTGDVSGAAGSVTIDGDVGGDVAVAGGSVVLGRGATVGGTMEVGAGSVRVDGTVRGDLRVGAEDVVLGPTASVGGNVEYDSQNFDAAPGATVGGTVRQVDDVGFTAVPRYGIPFGGFAVPRGTFAVYGFLVNLLLGAVLLVLLPGFSRRVTEFGTGEAAKSGVVGLLSLVGVPVVLVILLVTIIGIPLSLAGLFVYLLALWAASVYGALVLGTWLLSLVDVESRGGGLFLGLLLVALAALIPFGELLQFVVLLVGLGALVLALWGRSASSSGGDSSVGGEEGEGGEPGTGGERDEDAAGRSPA
ncbi:MAG: polymer-forming cytoskeletal protein [Haloferacaceae archaeon]